MSEIRSGKLDRLPYSLSRWTDLPAAKWAWFLDRLHNGWMIGVNPRTALPEKWSLQPEDVFGLVFWTRDAQNLVRSADVLKPYPLVIHYTLTGWHEVERGSPSIDRALAVMKDAAATFGTDRIVWRFSPVPVTTDVLDRFEYIAKGVSAIGIKEVFVAFLQENDLKNEPRPTRVRRELLQQMAARTDLTIQVCFEDSTPIERHNPRLVQGVCESGRRFTSKGWGVDWPKTENCGCALAVDPFTINESCVFGCEYCYAADKTLASKKFSTTKKHHLPVL